MSEIKPSRLPILELDLSGPDGNVFFILAKAGQLLSDTEAKEMRTRVYLCGSYERAKQIIGEYAELRDLSQEEEESQ